MRTMLRAAALVFPLIVAAPILTPASATAAAPNVEAARSLQDFANVYAYLKNGGLSSADLTKAFLANRNVYVFALQSVLAEGGHFSGRPSGLLTAPTVAAIIRFCRDHDLAELCARGPMADEAIAAIAPLLGDVFNADMAKAAPPPKPRPAPAPEPVKADAPIATAVEPAPAVAPAGTATAPVAAATGPAAVAPTSPPAPATGELVKNGTFDADLSGWSDGSTPPAKMIWKAGSAVVDTTTGGTARLVTSIPTVAGKTYSFSYSGDLWIRLGTAQNGSDIKALNVDGRSDGTPFTFVAPGDVVWIGIVDGNNGRVLDNVSLKPAEGQ